MKEITELVLNKYVIATFDNPTQYLVSEHFGKYSFTDNIQTATKTNSKKLANDVKNYFYQDTKLTDMELVVLPIKIEYKLINELEQ